MNNFVEVEKIGEGTYGTVFRAQHKETGVHVALKRINFAKDYEGVPSTAMREISHLRQLNHPSIIRLLDVYQNDENVYMIFEYFCMDLKKYFERCNGRLPEPLIKSYLRQLLDGLSYCHIHRILHRDLKPNNLLIDRQGHIKLADFGLSRSFNIPYKKYTHEVVTLWYRAPEILLGSQVYNSTVDTWSIGCIFGEMLTGKPIFTGDSEISQLFRIFEVLGTPNENVWPNVTGFPSFTASFPQWQAKNLHMVFEISEESGYELIQGLLTYNFMNRLMARKAVKSAFLQHAELVIPNLDFFNDVDNANEITEK